MRKLLLGILVILMFSMSVAPTLAGIVTGGGTLGSPATDIFGGNAMNQRSGEDIGKWTHSVIGDFIFQGDVEFLAFSYFSLEAYFTGTGKLNQEDGYTFEVLVRDDEIDHYHITIYNPDTTIHYEADQDLSGGNIILQPPNNGHPY
jgi:hypothetical protein